MFVTGPHLHFLEASEPYREIGSVTRFRPLPQHDTTTIYARIRICRQLLRLTSAEETWRMGVTDDAGDRGEGGSGAEDRVEGSREDIGGGGRAVLFGRKRFSRVRGVPSRRHNPW